MKKLINILIIITFLFLLFGCSSNNVEEDMKLSRVSLTDAFLEDGEWMVKQQQNIDYIRQLDIDKLLYFYYKNAGLPAKNDATPYQDWESNPPHLGITTGHYVSACSMLYAQTGDEWYKERVDYVIGELIKCQQDNGYLLAQPIERFDDLEAGKGIWVSGVPYYFVHKLLAAAIDAYTYCGNTEAIPMASKLADWVYGRMSVLGRNVRNQVLLVEYGGMAETLYRLYDITKSETHKLAAELFHEDLHFGAWASNTDNLYTQHANTSIPKAQGFLKAYLEDGDENMLNAAKNFFDMVVYDRTYPNGGNSRQECFGISGIIYGYTTDVNDNPSETCNIYNMIKLAYSLYELTGDGKYMDYIEIALLNGIMGSINTDGCKTYYQHMYTDAKKVFHKPTTGFWCCTGTGMENFAKVAEALYVNEGDGAVQVNIFVSSKYKDKNGFSFSLKAEDNKVKITITGDGNKTVKLRNPYWAQSASVKINGETVEATEEGGYFSLNRKWKQGDVIEYDIPYKTFLIRCLDNRNYFSLRYGPYLMVAVGEMGKPVIYGANNEEIGENTWRIEPREIGYVMLTDTEPLPIQKYGLVTEETYTMYLTVNAD
ncbi:MAG: beta-L-arabinofuranosidase domain-containing protein [Christensenellales bacterium]